MSKFPEKAEKSDDPHTQVTCYHRSLFPEVRSVTALSSSSPGFVPASKV